MFEPKLRAPRSQFRYDLGSTKDTCIPTTQRSDTDLFGGPDALFSLNMWIFRSSRGMPIYDTDLEYTNGTQLHFFVGVVIETFFAARFSRKWARSYRVQVTRQYLRKHTR